MHDHEQQARKTANEVDHQAQGQRARQVAVLLEQRPDLALDLAAHHVIHDGGSEEDFLAVARTAWERSHQKHEKGCA